MTDSREVQPGENAKAKVEGPDDVELGQTSSYSIPKPWVIPAPRGNLQYIFGTSQVFQGIDDVKPKAKGLMVPLKVREYYHRGQGCLEQEDWETAVVFFSRALHLDPELVDFYALRAEAFIQLCDFSSAAQNLRRAYVAQPENRKHLERLTFVLYLQGQYLYEHCNFKDALMVFSQASELQPEKPCFRYRSMACLLALQRHHDCLTLITRELRQGSPNADLYILRARIYNLFQMPNFCYRDLCTALLLDPEHPQAKVLLQMMVDQAQQAHQDAGVLAIQGRLQHALQRINCAIDNSPLDPSLFLFRGTMYRRLQEFDAAVEDFLKALDMLTDTQCDMVQQAQRQLLLTYNDFAVHCYKQGAYQEGVLLLNKALREEQREKGLYINRGGACGLRAGGQLMVPCPGVALDKLATVQATGKRYPGAPKMGPPVGISPQLPSAWAGPELLAAGGSLGPCPPTLDCFFQLGNLAFAEADYSQALALCPQDKGANIRMCVLQETMGLCEQKCRQLQKAEDHFSAAIQHNPWRAQCYLHRAKNRQILQDTLGARQDVATVLLLNPKQPKLNPLMTSLFPGMSVEEVLSSQVGQLAKLQLERMIESDLQAKILQGIVGVRELERQKAQALQLSWKLKWPLPATLREPELTSQMLQVSPEDSEEDTEASEGKKAKEEKEEDKPELTLPRATSLSDSYLDQASSDSVLGFRTAPTSETETSTPCQAYRSTSTTSGIPSDSSMPKTESSDSESKREAPRLSHQPRKSQGSQAQTQGGPEAAQSQGSGETEAAQGQRQKPSKIKATQSPRQRFRRAKAAHNWGRAQGPSKTKSKVSQDPSRGLSTNGSMLRETEATLDPGQGTSSSSTKLDATQSQSASRIKAGQGSDHGAAPQRPE
ncbi:PREDICTED: tetratricopeptide repeat protein 16 isoform X2 [Chinchilla lanigera]|uniref:tetratricopeptide repeat protein 16 isoform X2 n=1 Tax=Chinchilla lanigera TaxID=34839 RepID=UPI0006981AAD|nr:PREDICTED: tetratricopeptide repeat protein 16 isoform X2 [Chinchilla lanigera]